MKIPNLIPYPNYADPITTGDLSVAVVYRMTDADGSTWQSAPRMAVSVLKETETSLNASGQWLIIPTLRHLMEGTTAQIEIYIGSVSLQRFFVIENDPTIDYIEFSPNLVISNGGTAIDIQTAIVRAGVGEVLYTTGNALPNDPPPQCQALTVWRNRALCAFGNRIYVSQEFAAGRGIQWSYVLSMDWSEGSGDIIAICPIDWNYCAIFKSDAIGVISGPGPDGVGHGNYIVQTLPTKMGTDEPRSVVNGGDGAYFQDTTTHRMCVVTGQLQVMEAMPGWFNVSDYVWAAMQVEERRQLWFATSSGKIEVLDYKHKPEGNPMGQAFEWGLTAFGDYITGLTIVGGVPTAMLADGSTIAYSEVAVCDTLSDGSFVFIAQKVKTGVLQPAGLLGAFDVSRIVFLGDYANAHSLRITTYPDDSVSGDAKTLAKSAAPELLQYRPPNCQRIHGLEIQIEEVAATTGTPPATIHGKGFKFAGIGLEIQPRGRLRFTNTGSNV